MLRYKIQLPLQEHLYGLYGILKKIGLQKQGENFRKNVSPLELTNSIGIDVDFHFAIDVITDLATIGLECKVNGSVDLRELEPFDTASRNIKIMATPEDYVLLDRVLADFSDNPLAYDLSELVPQKDMPEMAVICKNLKEELLR